MDAERRVTLFTGNYGSGKTETAVSFTHQLLDQGRKVKILDLDVVNPYFRCREAREDLERRGAEVVAPRDGQFFADLPIILPQIRGALADPGSRCVGDVGGDDVGARVLSSLADVFQQDELSLYLVINKNRPFTEDVEGCLKMLGEIEAASRLKVNGLVANTHLMQETTAEMIYEGYELASEVGRRSGITVKLVAVESRLIGALDPDRIGSPLLPLRRVLLPPWAGGFRSDLSSLPV